MNSNMDTLHELTEIFRAFPGVGPRQAKRFVHHLLQRGEDAEALSALAARLRKSVVRCELCRRFFTKEGSFKKCRACRDEGRDKATLLIVARAENAAKEGLKEIVLALSANPEGEHTAETAARILAPLAKEHNIKISTLGRGLSTGTELEYADAETLKSAFKNEERRVGKECRCRWSP